MRMIRDVIEVRRGDTGGCGICCAGKALAGEPRSMDGRLPSMLPRFGGEDDNPF